MFAKRSILKIVALLLFALACLITGALSAKFYLNPASKFTEAQSDIDLDMASSQLITKTLYRKREVMGVRIYCISIRDKRSGQDIPLLTLENTFQERSLAPRFVKLENQTAFFSSASGIIKITLPNIAFEGLNEEIESKTIYPGPPK